MGLQAPKLSRRDDLSYNLIQDSIQFHVPSADQRCHQLLRDYVNCTTFESKAFWLHVFQESSHVPALEAICYPSNVTAFIYRRRVQYGAPSPYFSRELSNRFETWFLL